ncbi:MAG: hypothetical protein M1296_07195 [Chloroflexi bacterium]|nr:hypothetical protein [Chloroflexota bacterium]
MDPSPDFARVVRAQFPKAFIIGRRYVANQPLNDPAAQGRAFADYVAQLAVPLRGVVNAWMSYNEESSYTNPAQNNYAAWNTFQVAFAGELHGHFGIAAVAGNDATEAVTPEDYVKYFSGAIEASQYFGVHEYTPPGVSSMQSPAGQQAMLRYRAIYSALVKAGIHPPPFILTETGLYNGWRGQVSDEQMVQDWEWLTSQLDADPYVIGQTAYGLFPPGSGQWERFNVGSTILERDIGYYNSCTPAHPCPPGEKG